MTDAESQITRAVDNLNLLAEKYYKEMTVIDKQISLLIAKRDEALMLYNQCVARLRDFESDLEWVQSE